MGLYAACRTFGHRFLPALIEPYRYLLFKWRDLRHIPAQLHDIRQIHRKQFGFHNDYPPSVEEFYTPGSSASPKQGVVFMCDGRISHGGLTDRLRGLLTVYSAARRRRLPFYVHWVSPFPLDKYLIPAGPVDWRINPSELSYCLGDAYPAVIIDKGDPQTFADNALRLRAALHKPMAQTHVYSNSNNSRRRFASLYRELFRPSPMLRSELDRHLAVLGTDFHVFTFRFIGLLGDFVDLPGVVLAPGEQRALINQCVSKLLECMSELPSASRVLVTSDSSTFLKAADGADPRIYVIPGDIHHMDLDPEGDDATWLKTFVEQQLIMNARSVTRMRTGRMYRSGFPVFAANVGGVPFREISF